MNAVALTALLTVLGAGELSPQIQEGEGAIGVRAGYRYVPNPYFAETARDRDPVVSPYFGSAAVNLNCQYFALPTVPVVIDLDWGGERLELSSGGWIDTHAIAVGLSSGYLLEIDFVARPYAIVGVDMVNAIVTDHLATGSTVTGYKPTFGVHGAFGLMAPAFIPSLPWLAASAELRYTFAPLTQRGLDYWVLGVAATVGLAARFDASQSWR
ncbi:MAG: hypothetical protein JXR83_18020 [Deltaproteobacteria bacterium]|nr:hypothetical protein [Deltaproteobacteria bacterium]